MFKPTNLLIVDDDPAISRVFEKIAKGEEWTSQSVDNGTDAVDVLSKQAFEAAVVDIALPGPNGMQILEYAKQNNINTEIIIMTGVGSLEMAVKAIKTGAYDYFTKPFDDINKISSSISKAMERYRMVQKLKKLERLEKESVSYEGIIGRSKKMQDVYELIESVAGTTSTILILGESGTGKELVAKALHSRSRRSQKPFVVINCAAMPESLLESELFGHRKGSFTGAIADKKGLFEEANGGTIFLDEIGEVSTAIQVKLLRVLQEGEVKMVGDNTNKHVDVRVIAATNKDLTEQVAKGKFREDLFYRLNVITLPLPPLRDRVDDIPLLIYHFLEKYSKKMGKEVKSCSPEAVIALQHYKWTGNVRELENVIERSVVLTNDPVIHVNNLPARVVGNAVFITAEDTITDLTNLNYQEAKNKAFETFNKAYMMGLLRQAKGNFSFAAAKAGMDRSNFKKILRKFKIAMDDYNKLD